MSVAEGYTLLDVSLWSPTFEYIVKLDHALMWILLGFTLIGGATLLYFMWSMMTIYSNAKDRTDVDYLSSVKVLERRMEPIIGLTGFIFGMFILSIFVFMRYNDLSQLVYFNLFPTYQLPGKVWTFQFNNILDWVITYTVLGSLSTLVSYSQEVKTNVMGIQLILAGLVSLLYVANKAQYYTNTFWWLMLLGGAAISSIVPMISIVLQEFVMIRS